MRVQTDRCNARTDRKGWDRPRRRGQATQGGTRNAVVASMLEQQRPGKMRRERTNFMGTANRMRALARWWGCGRSDRSSAAQGDNINGETSFVTCACNWGSTANSQGKRARNRKKKTPGRHRRSDARQTDQNYRPPARLPADCGPPSSSCTGRAKPRSEDSTLLPWSLVTNDDDVGRIDGQRFCLRFV